MATVTNSENRESFIQQYFPSMMAKAVQMGADEQQPTGPAQQQETGGEGGSSLPPPPAYEPVSSSRNNGYRSLLD